MKQQKNLVYLWMYNKIKTTHTLCTEEFMYTSLNSNTLIEVEII